MKVPATRLCSTVVTTFVAIGAIAAVQSPAAAAVSGTVYCTAGEVQGVYVDSAGSGQDGFASFSSFSGGANYSRTAVNAGYRINVGCGGTPQNWQFSIWSAGGLYYGNQNFVCHATQTVTQRYCYAS